MSVKGYNHFRKNFGSYNQAILFKDIYPVEMRTYIERSFCSFIPNGKKSGNTAITINGKMDKQAVVHSYTGILHRNNKE